MYFLDVRMRNHWEWGLLNFHSMEITLCERHTGEYLFEVLKRFLDEIWSNKCVAVSKDGSQNMADRVQGLAIRIKEYCMPEIP